MADWGTEQGHKSRDWAIVERYLLEDLRDRQRQRRWAWLRRTVFFVLLAFAAVMVFMDDSVTPQRFGAHTAMVSIDGVISSGTIANADLVVEGLTAAFENVDSQAVVMRINSPGGSPVQSDVIFNEARRLRALYPDKPLYAVIEDSGASGAYYIAVAADKIFVNGSSLVGSIGVIMPSFGVPELLKNLGVEDRTMIAGEHKNLLSPTRAIDPVEQAHVQSVLDSVHRQFIEAVKLGRGDRLSPNPDLFSGYFWSGEQAVSLGLADAVGSLQSVARDVVKAESIVDYTVTVDPILLMLEQLGVSFGQSIVSGLAKAAGVQASSSPLQ